MVKSCEWLSTLNEEGSALRINHSHDGMGFNNSRIIETSPGHQNQPQDGKRVCAAQKSSLATT